MHQTAGHSGASDESGHLRVVFQAPDIVDQIGACLDGCGCHLCLVGIDGHGDIEAGFHCLDDWGYPLDFLVLGNLLVTGTGRLAADIQNGGALADHLLRMDQRCVHVVPFAAVREGIRGYIQNSHDIGFILYVEFFGSDFHTFSL